MNADLVSFRGQEFSFIFSPLLPASRMGRQLGQLKVGFFGKYLAADP